jgi:hypothetical protein
MAEATLDSIAGLVFQRLGVEGLRELFSNPDFIMFRDEIVDIGDRLKAHGLTDAAEAMYEISKDFPKLPRTNPYSETNPNWHWWQDNLERAEHNGEAAKFRERNRHLQKDRLRVERGLPPMCGSFAGERPWQGT